MLHPLVVLAAAEAEEKSKVPFFICGGLLACWAIVMFAIGMRSQTFPGGERGQRGVIAVSVVLVAGPVATPRPTARRRPQGAPPLALGTAGIRPSDGGPTPATA